jgi:hypothetical protein
LAEAVAVAVAVVEVVAEVVAEVVVVLPNRQEKQHRGHPHTANMAPLQVLPVVRLLLFLCRTRRFLPVLLPVLPPPYHALLAVVYCVSTNLLQQLFLVVVAEPLCNMDIN